MSPPIPAQRSTTIGLAWNRMALYRATGSAVACSTPTGSTHIRSPRSNFAAAFRRASVNRTAADDHPGRGQLPQPVQLRRADRPDRRDLLEQPAARVGRQEPELVVDAGIVLASCSGRIGARMREWIVVASRRRL